MWPLLPTCFYVLNPTKLWTILNLIPYNSSGSSTECSIVVSSPQTLIKLILANNPECLCCHPPIKFYMHSKSQQFYNVLLMYLLNKYNFPVIYRFVSIVNTWWLYAVKLILVLAITKYFIFIKCILYFALVKYFNVKSDLYKYSTYKN